MFRSLTFELKYAKLNIYAMMAIGVWPCWANQILQNLHTYFVIIYQALNNVSIIGTFGECGKSLSCHIENMSYFMVHFLGFYCAVMMVLKVELIKKCVIGLHILIDKHELNKFTLNAERIIHQFSVFVYIYTLIGTFLYNLSPIFMYHDCMTTLDLAAAPCGLPISESIPINIEKSPGYEAVYLFLYIGGNLAIYSITIAIMLPFNILFHIIAELEYLKANLRKITPNNSQIRNYEMLHSCVMHHIHIAK